MYYILIAFILNLYYNCQSKNDITRNKLDGRYSIYICIVLVILAAFRSDMVGADTLAYRMDYENMVYYHDFESLVDRFSISYIGYFGLSKLFHMAGMPVEVWFGFVEAFYLFALMQLIKRFSKDTIFSLLVFSTIGLFTFSLAGLKQTTGSALVMLAFTSFIEKKYVLTALLAIATYYTHPAALIGLGALPLYYVREKKWFIPMTIAICLAVYSYSMIFMSTMVEILGNEHFETYLINESSYSYVTFIFYAVISIISFLNFKSYNESDPEYAKLFLGLSTIGCGLQLLAGVSPSLFRLALMYTPFMTILLPNVAYYSNNKLVRYILMGCIIFYFLYTTRNSPYSFFF